MNILIKIVFGVLLLLTAACSQTYDTATVRFDDGDTLEVGTIEQGSQSAQVWRVTDAATGQAQTNVTTSTSMAGLTIPGVANTATGGLIQGAIALELDSRAADRCANGGCASGPENVITVSTGGAVATSVSDADAEANGTLTAGATPCMMPGPNGCAVMD